MSVDFASLKLSNATALCVGSITAAESESLRADGIEDDGFGYYLYLVNEAEPRESIEILAKFFTPMEATRFAELIGARC